MTTLLFVRHGFSLSNAKRTFTGQRDEPLSELGTRQAELASAYILAHYRPTALYASSLSRAIDTIRPLSDALSLPILPEAAFREIFGGCWEGMTAEEIASAYPEDYALWTERIGLSRPSGGEAVAEVQARAHSRTLEIARAHAGQTVVIATHAAVLRALECAWLGLPLSEMQSIGWIPNASVSEVGFDGERLFPIRTRITEHLGDCLTNLPRNI